MPSEVRLPVVSPAWVAVAPPPDEKDGGSSSSSSSSGGEADGGDGGSGSGGRAVLPPFLDRFFFVRSAHDMQAKLIQGSYDTAAFEDDVDIFADVLASDY